VAVLGQIVHGHEPEGGGGGGGGPPLPAVTWTPADAVSIRPLSSTARDLIVYVPDVAGRHVYVQLVVPVAGFQETPPSTDTSTADTTPPPASVAVPLMVVSLVNGTVAPAAGEVMVDVGAVESVVWAAATSPVIREPGWTPMSARRLTVACWTAASGLLEPRSWFPSSPHAH
jgi:hypothetical protein